MAEQALSVARKVGDQEGIALADKALAHALALQGKFPEAVNLYKESVASLRKGQEPGELAFTLLDFGDAQLDQGDLDGARNSYEEARIINDRFPPGFAKPEIELALARLSLASAQADEASVHARAAMDIFAAAGREGGRLSAAAVLIRALLAQGKSDAGSRLIQQIAPGKSDALPLRAAFEFRIAKCLVLAETGNRAAAERDLQHWTMKVDRLGLSPLVKEARLAKSLLERAPVVSTLAS